jgi:chromosome segregation ATPase
MIESIMFFSAGFLLASLLGLALISSVHHRAVRLTQRRLEDAIPVSLTEIQADRDRLRAEFAMSIRRLEMTVEQLEATVTNQRGEIARKWEAIARLKAQLSEKNVVADGLAAKLKSLSIENRETEQEHAAQSAAAEASALALAAREAELSKAAINVNELTLTSETQKVEIALLKTQIEQFRSRIAELERDSEGATQRLFNERAAASAMTKALDEKREVDDTQQRAERAEIELLRERIADIAAQVAHMLMNETGSPPAAILNDTAGIRQAGFERAPNGGDAVPSRSSLLERIRNLQSARSRVSSAS